MRVKEVKNPIWGFIYHWDSGPYSAGSSEEVVPAIWEIASENVEASDRKLAYTFATRVKKGDKDEKNDKMGKSEHILPIFLENWVKK